MKRILVLAPLVAIFLTGCECFDAKAGTLSVKTDCAQGELTESTVAFAQLPNGVAKGQFDELLSGVPQELRAFVGDIACQELIDPQSISDLCAPLGVGGGLEPFSTENATDTRVVMCGGQMFTMGGFEGGIYFCKADQAVIDGQIWFMECQQLSLSTSQPTGTCQGIVEFDQQVGR